MGSVHLRPPQKRGIIAALLEGRKSHRQISDDHDCSDSTVSDYRRRLIKAFGNDLFEDEGASRPPPAAPAAAPAPTATVPVKEARPPAPAAPPTTSLPPAAEVAVAATMRQHGVTPPPLSEAAMAYMLDAFQRGSVLAPSAPAAPAPRSDGADALAIAHAPPAMPAPVAAPPTAPAPAAAPLAAPAAPVPAARPLAPSFKVETTFGRAPESATPEETERFLRQSARGGIVSADPYEDEHEDPRSDRVEPKDSFEDDLDRALSDGATDEQKADLMDGLEAVKETVRGKRGKGITLMSGTGNPLAGNAALADAVIDTLKGEPPRKPVGLFDHVPTHYKAKVGDVLDVVIDGKAHKPGDGVAHVKGLVVFVKGREKVGDYVKVRVWKEYPTFVVAVPIEQ